MSLTVDISRYQGVISVSVFQAWRAFGVDRVILKLGGGDSGRYEDSRYQTNKASAYAAGLAVEGYWFNGLTDPVGDATFACSIADPGMRIWWDVENEGSMPHWAPVSLNAAARTAAALGHQVGAYMSSSVTFEADWSSCTWMPLWVANYSASTTPRVGHWTSPALWQYTSSGHLPGYSGNLDLDKEITAIASTGASPIGEDMPLTAADMNLFLNYPAWTGGPTISSALKNVNDALFNGGSSMSDGHKSIAQSLAEIHAVVAQPVQRTLNGKVVLIPQIQDNADTNTFVRSVLPAIARIEAAVEKPAAG